MVDMLKQELALAGISATPRQEVRVGHWHHQAALEEQAACV
jgi:hypothetical protein